MSWMSDDLPSLSEACDDAFGTPGVVTPMLANPNARAAPDPKRKPFDVLGVFHEGHRYAGDSARNSDGLKETKLASTVTTYEIDRLYLEHKPTQGDLLYLPELRRRFRIADITLGMPGRTKLILESIDKLDMT